MILNSTQFYMTNNTRNIVIGSTVGAAVLGTAGYYLYKRTTDDYGTKGPQVDGTVDVSKQMRDARAGAVKLSPDTSVCDAAVIKLDMFKKDWQHYLDTITSLLLDFQRIHTYKEEAATAYLKGQETNKICLTMEEVCIRRLGPICTKDVMRCTKSGYPKAVLDEAESIRVATVEDARTNIQNWINAYPTINLVSGEASCLTSYGAFIGTLVSSRDSAILAGGGNVSDWQPEDANS